MTSTPLHPDARPPSKPFAAMSDAEWYSYATGNHPTIHCNRFASWSELTPRKRKQWLEGNPRPQA